MNSRAVKILFNTYWSSAGWRRDADRTVSAEDFEYAKAQGTMFDRKRLSRKAVIDLALTIRSELNPRLVGNGFLASLSSRRLDLRSALGSFSVLRFLPEHLCSPSDRQCSLCGLYESANELQDLNVLNFERLKWGGVRHDDLLYATFDLTEFVKLESHQPTDSDRKIFRQLISIIESHEPNSSAATLSKSLAVADWKSSVAERKVAVCLLGLCGVLRCEGRPSYAHDFVRYDTRKIPPHRFVELPYPVCWWKGKDGIDHNAIEMFFGHVL